MDSHNEKSSTPTWQDFTQDTTMHGIRYVKMKSITNVRRVCWTVFLILSIGYFCFGACLLFNDFLRKKTITKIRHKNADNLTFPTVTICNRNFWKKSEIEDPNYPPQATETMRELVGDLYALNRQNQIPADKYDWGSEVMHIIDINRTQTELETNETLGRMAHSAKETFKYCFVEGQMVNCSAIFVTVKTDAGFCFRYNQHGDVVVNVAGAMGGLMLALDAVVAEYYVGPYSYSEGFAVAIHDKDEEPIMTGLSYSAGVSADTSLIIQKRETRRVPPPADYGQADCIDMRRSPKLLQYYTKYSETGCKIECETSYIMKQCGGCRPYLSPLDINEMKENWAMITLYYGQMSYEIIEETPAINAVDFVAALGGTLGVAIGGSFLTIIEFVEFAILSLSTYISQRRAVTTTRGSNSDYQTKKPVLTPVKAFRNSITDGTAYQGSGNIYS